MVIFENSTLKIIPLRAPPPGKKKGKLVWMPLFLDEQVMGQEVMLKACCVT